MRKRTLALCLTLLAMLALGSSGAGAGEIEDLSAEIFGRKPAPMAGCRISCNTDFNVYCTGSGLFTCSEGVDSGDYYIQCNQNRYYCPPCPTGNPYDCLD